ncbi:hypothetical protein [Verrucosispora sp. NA02020]|uniref:hypothetical protein n=1 Tax=Verrucosispora sp. NA02020 TaxID=2742132 RepID=UPI0015915337|nr:hypothetical protein [Verrucosispora sp. NA02020]QKW17625.1 hypothetical protein HUT12_32510 [Verrucosispora sp. NA02020]
MTAAAVQGGYVEKRHAPGSSSFIGLSARSTGIRLGSPAPEKKEGDEEPDGSSSAHNDRSSQMPQPAVSDWEPRALMATATGLEATAEILHATGHDGLAAMARTIAHLLHLVAILVGERGGDQK